MDQSTSRLLSLPRELRDEIWRQTFVDDVVQLDRTEGQSTAPGLLLACRQSHLEAIHLYYKHATFFFCSGKKCSRWLEKVARCHQHLHPVARLHFETAASQIRHVAATWHSPEDAKVALAVFHLDLLHHGVKIGERVVQASIEGCDGMVNWSVEFPLDPDDATCIAIVSALPVLYVSWMGKKG